MCVCVCVSKFVSMCVCDCVCVRARARACVVVMDIWKDAWMDCARFMCCWFCKRDGGFGYMKTSNAGWRNNRCISTRMTITTKGTKKEGRKAPHELAGEWAVCLSGTYTHAHLYRHTLRAYIIFGKVACFLNAAVLTSV